MQPQTANSEPTCSDITSRVSMQLIPFQIYVNMSPRPCAQVAVGYEPILRPEHKPLSLSVRNMFGEGLCLYCAGYFYSAYGCLFIFCPR